MSEEKGIMQERFAYPVVKKVTVILEFERQRGKSVVFEFTRDEVVLLFFLRLLGEGKSAGLYGNEKVSTFQKALGIKSRKAALRRMRTAAYTLMERSYIVKTTRGIFGASILSGTGWEKEDGDDDSNVELNINPVTIPMFMHGKIPVSDAEREADERKKRALEEHGPEIIKKMFGGKRCEDHFAEEVEP